MKIRNKRPSAAGLVCAVTLGVIATSCDYAITGPNGSDPNLGYVDGLGLDPKFQPTPKGATCANGACYPTQQGWANGKAIYFYNVGAVAATAAAAKFSFVDSSGSFAVPEALTFANVYDFGAEPPSQPSCTPPTSPYTFDPVTEAYPSNLQFPIFSNLPLVSYVFDSVVVPYVARYGATEPSSTTCQYLKDANSVGAKFGSQPGSVADYRMWPVIDVVTATYVSATSGIASNAEVNGATCLTPDGKSIPCPVQELNSTSLTTQCTNTFNQCLSACGVKTTSGCTCPYGASNLVLNCGNDGHTYDMCYLGNCPGVSVARPGACAGNDSVCSTECETQFIQCSTLQRQGWYNGLQLTFLDGGPIPMAGMDPGTLVAMNGVIVHPTPVLQTSSPSAEGVVILPAMPGDPDYSPIVLLHDYHVPAGDDVDTSGDFSNASPFGKYTSLCTSGLNCQPNEVNMANAGAVSTILFIVTSAP
jgi:hypothetical protein